MEEVDSKCGVLYLSAGESAYPWASAQSAAGNPDFIYINQPLSQMLPHPDELHLSQHHQLIDFEQIEQQQQQLYHQQNQQQQLFTPAGLASSPTPYRLTSPTDLSDCSGGFLLAPVVANDACSSLPSNGIGQFEDPAQQFLAASRAPATTTINASSSAMSLSMTSDASPPSSTSSRGGSNRKLKKSASAPCSGGAADTACRPAGAAAAGEPKVKTPMMVAKRNARERRRVEAVNSAFAKLRKYIPYEKRNKRLSKVKTLRITIEYIRLLERVLEELDNGVDVAASENYKNLLVMAQRKELSVPLTGV